MTAVSFSQNGLRIGSIGRSHSVLPPSLPAGCCRLLFVGALRALRIIALKDSLLKSWHKFIF